MPSLSIDFLDVGQGDGNFITFPDGTTMLVDLGSTKNKRLVQRSLHEFFAGNTKFGQPGRTLDYLVLTHGDADHYNLVEDFLSTFSIDVGNLLFGGRVADYRGLIERLHAAQPTMNLMGDPPGYPCRIGSFGRAEVWLVGMNALPITKPRDAAWRKNTGSVVLQIRYGGNQVMLTGDATIDTEQRILSHYEARDELAGLASTVLKVQHHGSAVTSLRPSWVAAVRPAYVFVSADRSGSRGHGIRQTGYGLPHELAIDVIRANTELATAADHHYVSSYSPGRYRRYRNRDTKKKGFATKPGDDTTRWEAWSTTEAIFTSLIAMDAKSPDGSIADQGAQFEVVLTAGGAIDVRVTE